MTSEYQLEDGIDLAVNLEYLQVVLKKCDIKAVPINELFIYYFSDNLRPLIWSYFDTILTKKIGISMIGKRLWKKVSMPKLK